MLSVHQLQCQLMRRGECKYTHITRRAHLIHYSHSLPEAMDKEKEKYLGQQKSSIDEVSNMI